MKKYFKEIGVVVTAGILFALPVATFAINVSWGIALTFGNSTGSGGSTVGSVLGTVYGIVNALITIMIALAVLSFLMGILRYISAGDSDENRTKGRNLMVYGIIGIAVMVSVWGLVNILINTFKLDNSTIPNPPILPQP